jgi:hypothetical protein
MTFVSGIEIDPGSLTHPHPDDIFMIRNSSVNEIKTEIQKAQKKSVNIEIDLCWFSQCCCSK